MDKHTKGLILYTLLSDRSSLKRSVGENPLPEGAMPIYAEHGGEGFPLDSYQMMLALRGPEFKQIRNRELAFARFEAEALCGGFQPVRTDDIEVLKEYRSARGNTALYEAADVNHCGAVTALIAGGHEVNSRNTGGQTPLDAATSFSEWLDLVPSSPDPWAGDILKEHGGTWSKNLPPIEE